MPRLSANLSMLFTEVDFLDRFELAARVGFKGVEYLFPYKWHREQLMEQLDKYGLEQVVHNLPAGDWAGGDRGTACLPGREGEFQDGVGLAIEYAKALNCPRLNCLAGLTPEGVSADKVRKILINNLRFAANALEKEGMKLLVEAINGQDLPRFYLQRTRDVQELLTEVAHPNIWIQYDIYHMQIMEGNLTTTIRNNLGRIAHMQLADNPGRHEPQTGEINYENLLHFIDEAGYGGWIGCEYKPSGRTEDSLVWAKEYLV